MDGRNPYKLNRPACISFSGGRSSGYMLKHILDAFGGELPPDVHVIFSNTGKERPATLEFVAACAELWGVRIHWLEYDRAAPSETREVSFATASRTGEPFDALIDAKRFLPNPVNRLCTENLKVKRMIAWMRDVRGYDHWENAVGYRADEPNRVAGMRRRNDSGKERFEAVAPMSVAGVTRATVAAWWRAQPFDLGLPSIDNRTPAGNCDLCFMKGRANLVELIREQPESAEWWIEQERKGLADKPDGARFRANRPSYAQLREIAYSQVKLPWTDDDEGMPCFCTD